MKKLIAVLAGATLLIFAAVAYAHGPGWFGKDQVCPVYGEKLPMKGPGYHGHGPGKRDMLDQKFLDSTADLRRELHNKKFEFFEAQRNPDTPPDTIADLKDDIRQLRLQIREKAKGRTFGRPGRYGCM
ncbi:MAG: hypothetical protein AB1552_00705 [Nitrospirota bacterium]